jgi:hypothetical protein
MQLHVGDSVAILPCGGTPADTIEIAQVEFVGTRLAQINGCRMFYVSDGRSLQNDSDCIQPATEAHRAACPS